MPIFFSLARLLATIFLLAAYSHVSVASSVREQAIQLKLGEVHVIDVGDVSDVIVGNEELLSVQLVDQELLVIKALKNGHTELLLRYQDKNKLHRISISIASLAPTNEQVQLAWLSEHMPELSISEHENFVLISGSLSKSKYELLKQQSALHKHWLLQVSVEPEKQGRMIELEVKILEVKRQYARQLGIRWPGSYTGPQISESAENWITLPVEIQSTLNLLEQSGHARILAEPKLVAASGQQAEFLVGGEFPIPQVVGQGLQDVSFREYGIALDMAPVDLGQKGISTSIKAEISTIDPATSVNGIPGMLTRRVSSSITAASGELIVLSGLLSQEQSTQADLFPFLNQLPILGGLFRSKQFRSAETELLVIVSPQFKDDIDQHNVRIENAQAAIDDFRMQASCVGLIDGL
ncbi:type II and III secretion system protein family protein [Pseudidiomarina woesei]|uniref:Flp pilus assembly protein, secretin CpaC n=1 Tax=Pseudidiomarina woesei TaxID=1381080 RepID=A0A0K6HBL7_9GAMM|nr:pilus assembly protein N-terminal domain-containing protein [Pseudidiomarina woesei]CUA88394.1 Flp pilus assembly protein, secretin CpaC [Pseudidiomarina woesei]